jgi:exosortase/archaeosortase family protein
VRPLRREELAFLARFALLFGAPYLALHLVDVTPLAANIAHAQVAALSLAGVPAFADGPLLYVAGSPAVYQIVADCTGLVMVILLFALLWATPIDPRARLPALLAFAPFLLAFNLVRLAATLLVGAWHGPAALEAAHVALWFVDSGVVLALWARVAGVRLI